MRRVRLAAVIALLCLIVAGSALSTPVSAQDKTVFWDQFNVNIEIQPNGDFIVTEENVIEFSGDTFTFGNREIPTDRLEALEVLSVSFDGQQLEQVDSGTRPGTFHRYNASDDTVGVRYYFQETLGRHTAVLTYRVKGGLRYYEDGDQLWWKAVYSDRGGHVGTSRIVVTLPQAVGAENLRTAMYRGSDETGTGQILDNGRRVVFEAQNIPNGTFIEARVQFPHGIVAGSAPAWQVAADRRETLQPLFNLAFGGIGLLIALAGGVGSIMLWYSRGRDVPVALQAEYLSEPPDDTPPGVVGTLLDEKAETRDVVATIVDLARRGAITFEEEKKQGFLSEDYEFTLYLDDESKADTSFEKETISSVFGSRSTRTMDDLKNKFYKKLPGIQEELYQAAVDAGYFEKSPESVRNRWMGIGIGTIFVILCAAPFVLGLMGEVFESAMDFAPALLCIPAAGVFAGLAFVVAGRAMPRKTRKGAELASKWEAFKRYLENIEQYGDLENAKEIWDEYLPYAIAFGIDDRLLNAFEKVNAPVPAWYYPHGYHHHHRHRTGSSGGSGVSSPGRTESGGGRPSIQRTSDSMAGGLQSMSTGLATMIQSASSTLSSQPSSSGSSGGWSGGGGGGGGGSGGFG